MKKVVIFTYMNTLCIFMGYLPALKSVGPNTFPIIIYDEEHDVDI